MKSLIVQVAEWFYPKVIFKPRPRCIRDSCEIWIIHHNGFLEAFNLAGLIPYFTTPLALGLGFIVSYVIEPNAVSWENPKRYMPVLLGPGLGIVFECVIRQVITGSYYRNVPEHDELAMEKFADDWHSGRISKSTKGKSRKTQVLDEDDAWE